MGANKPTVPTVDFSELRTAVIENGVPLDSTINNGDRHTMHHAGWMCRWGGEPVEVTVPKQHQPTARDGFSQPLDCVVGLDDGNRRFINVDRGHALKAEGKRSPWLVDRDYNVTEFNQVLTIEPGDIIAVFRQVPKGAPFPNNGQDAMMVDRGDPQLGISPGAEIPSIRIAARGRSSFGQEASVAPPEP